MAKYIVFRTQYFNVEVDADSVEHALEVASGVPLHEWGDGEIEEIAELNEPEQYHD